MLLIISIILFLILLFYLANNKGTCSNVSNEIFISDNKPYIWVFWDGFEPDYIKLCYETLINKCSNNFNIVKLNNNTIHKYLPELKNYNFNNLIIQHKVDIYRIMLLYKYGGIYIDADIIVLKDLSDIINKLKKYDFVGFGCTGKICTNYYGYPSNWLLASKPKTILMKNILTKQLDIINNKLEYHDIGKKIIWEELQKLMSNGYQYYHYNPKYDGSRDINGYWINSDIIFSDIKIEYENIDNMLVYVFYNSDTSNKLKKLSKEELLNKNWNYTKFIKKGLLF